MYGLGERGVLLVTLLAASTGCGLYYHRPVGGPNHRYVLPDFEVVGPQGHGWTVAGGRWITKDGFVAPQDKDIVAPTEARILMFNRFAWFPPEYTTYGAYALLDPRGMPDGGFEGLRRHVEERAAHEFNDRSDQRHDVSVTVADDEGHRCVRAAFDAVSKGARPQHYRGVAYFCPESTAPNARVVRVGWFISIPERSIGRAVDIAPEFAPVLRSLDFGHHGARSEARRSRGRRT